jgi:hypothetical protein
MTISRMVDTIIGRDVLKLKRIHALQAGHIVAILMRVRAALVMCLNAAVGAEVKPGGEGIELI